MFQAFADRRMVVEQELDQWRWLKLCQVLVGETSHRAFECSYHLRRLQRILISPVLNSSTQPVANGHHNQAEQAHEYQYKRHSGDISQTQIVVLHIHRPVQSQIDQV
jgi:hypothetical protein